MASKAVLATQVLNTEAPPWAVAHEALRPHISGHFEVAGSRSFNDIFRIPNMGGVIRDWLFTRPTIEAVGEDAFANSTAESSTMLRIEGVFQDRNILVTPTVSSHLLLVPCQSINGLTVGLAYIDVTYERDANILDNRVPTLRLGRFAIDDATGETFLTGWSDNVMVVDWTQSIIKCERVREILLFEAPPDGGTPRNLMLRNSFFQRRHCALCGIGNSINSLPPPCSGINRRISQDPTKPPTITNVASLYRRFRGSYCGIVLKTPYGTDHQPVLQQRLPIIIDSKHGLHTVRTSFKNNLRKNIDIVLGPSSSNGFFGLHPRSCTKVLLLRAGTPVAADESWDACDTTDGGFSRGSSVDPMHSESPMTVAKRETSMVDPNQDFIDAPQRCRAEDSLNRESVLHKRKVRNRLSAQRSNKMRKIMLDAKKSELEDLKLRLPGLRERLAQLKSENHYLRLRVYGFDASNPSPPLKDEDEQYGAVAVVGDPSGEQEQAGENMDFLNSTNEIQDGDSSLFDDYFFLDEISV